MDTKFINGKEFWILDDGTEQARGFHYSDITKEIRTMKPVLFIAHPTEKYKSSFVNICNDFGFQDNEYYTELEIYEIETKDVQ